jgi:hypothetical protein
MTVKELMEILEHEIQMGRGNYKVVLWDIDRVEATDTIRDSAEQKFYICTEN